jgi:hypothetical protein
MPMPMPDAAARPVHFDVLAAPSPDEPPAGGDDRQSCAA